MASSVRAIDYNLKKGPAVGHTVYNHRIVLELWSAGGDTNESVRLGELVIDDFALHANEDGTAVTNFSQVQIFFTPPSGSDSAVGRNLLSGFVHGNSQNITLRGARDGSGTNSSIWKSSMSAFSTSAILPGLVENRLVLQAWMDLPSMFSPQSLPTSMQILNPFSAALTVKRAHCEVYLCKKRESETKCAEFDEKSMGYYSQLQALGGSLVRVTGPMYISIGDVDLAIDYEEGDVPISLR